MGIDVPDALTNDIGPLPAWGWAFAGVAGIALGRLARGKSVKGTTSTSDTDSEISYGANPGGQVTLPQGYASGPVAGTSGSDLEEFESNTAWFGAASDWLIGQGYEPLLAQSAINDYLQGRTLTFQTAPAINDLLSNFTGPPRPPTSIAREAPETGPVTEPVQDIYQSDPSSDIVRKAYRDFLGRDPEAEGLEFWRSRLASGEINSEELRRQIGAASDKELQQRLANQ